jgi:hypothetical protein
MVIGHRYPHDELPSRLSGRDTGSRLTVIAAPSERLPTD